MVWKKGAAVAIWGSGLNAEKVYVKYAGKYDIRIVVDNFKNKESIFNKKIVSAEEFFCDDEFCYLKIIIASDKWKEISEQLRSKGLRAGEDFLPYVMLDTREILVTQILELCRQDEIKDFLDIVRNNRKIVVFWGNCQTNGIREFCKWNEEFNHNYYILRYPQIWNTKELLACCDYEMFWEKCELVIMQKISVNNTLSYKFSTEYRRKILNNYNPKCKVISIPNLHFEGYYPQLGKEVISSLKNVQWEGVRCRDSNIIRMVDSGLGDEEIISRITSEEFYSKEYVQQHFQNCISMMKDWEKDCDIKVSDYLNQNRILYWSPIHPHVEVIYEISIRLLKTLGIKDVHIREYERIGFHLERIHYFHRTEYIYPSVLKGLDIVDYEDNHRINSVIYEMTVTGRDMLESYIALCRGYRGEKTV